MNKSHRGSTEDVKQSNWIYGQYQQFLLMEEILHYLGVNYQPQLVSRISSINSIIGKSLHPQPHPNTSQHLSLAQLGTHEGPSSVIKTHHNVPRAAESKFISGKDVMFVLKDNVESENSI